MDDLKELLEDLKSLRDDYIEEIPQGMISGKAKYKAQGNWFQMISLMVGYGIENVITQDKEIIDAHNAFQDYLKSTKIFRRLKNEEDIKRGNELLELVIKYAEREISKN